MSSRIHSGSFEFIKTILIETALYFNTHTNLSLIKITLTNEKSKCCFYCSIFIRSNSL